MNKVINVTYASSLANLCEVNSSFETGVLRICYTGENRNGSYISKESIEESIKTIYNCPIVCNYDRETDTLGGHDIEIIRDDNGGLHIVNITQPIGVIPESARVWFEEYEEEDGTVKEYLYAEVLLWKRQEAYQKIKEDGITAHSMEITVKDGEIVDDVYHINKFEFTAFALIGVEPCYESAALEVFSKQDFKQQLSEMMQELKESFNQVTTSVEVDNKHPQNYSMEGGRRVLKEKMELIAKYGIDIESLDFSIEDYTVEELIEKFEAMKSSEGDNTLESVEPETQTPEEKFALTHNVIDELVRVLSEVKVEREWGECDRYCYVDSDLELNEVYCWDRNDWLLYGFTYSVDGDSITIDFDSKQRKKYIIADFDEGEQPSPFAQTFVELEQKLSESIEVTAKYQTATDTIQTMEKELVVLRKFKSDKEEEVEKSDREAIFEQFEDLVGNETFEELRKKCMEYDLETLEDKCYAIRGRNGITASFSHQSKNPKLKIEKTDVSNEPYGGLFVQYGTEGN